MKPAELHFRESDGYLIAELPPEASEIFEHAISLRVESDMGKLAPNESQSKLVEQILGRISEIVAAAEDKLLEFEGEETGIRKHITRPHMWLFIDDLREAGDWSFVVERDDWPGYRVHIEFSGAQFKEIWGGD